MVRANNKPYMTKNSKESNRTPENNKAYRKQQNFCSRLYKKERRKYYSSFDIKKLHTDNKKFWETIKQFCFSDKGPNNQNITFSEQ